MNGSRARFRLGLGTLWRSVGRGSATLATATLAGGALVYLATPLVAHIFDPAALGDYGVYLAVVALLTPVATQNYVEAIALPASDSEAWSLTKSILANATRFSLFALATVALVSGLVAGGVLGLRVPPVTWVVPLGVFFAGAQATMLLWLVRREQYAPSVRARLTQGATMAIGQPVLGMASGLTSGPAGALPLASADAISTGLGFLVLVRACGDGVRLRHLIGIRRDAPLLRRYRQFMTSGLPATVINTLTLQIPLLVIAATYGSTSAGQFALVQRLVLTPVGVVTGAISLVLVRQSAMRADDPTAVRQLFSRIMAVLALFGSPLLLLALIDLDAGTARLLGPEWIPAAQMLPPLAVLCFTNLVVTPWGAAVAVAQRQDLFLLREVVRLAILAVAAGVIVLTSPPLTTAVFVLAGAGIASYVWYWAVCSFALRHPRSSEPPGLEPVAGGRAA